MSTLENPAGRAPDTDAGADLVSAADAEPQRDHTTKRGADRLVEALTAEGYARASGRVGVAIVTSGPGATNLVTAIADAYADSLPTVFITAQVPTTLRGSNAFQECDVIGMTAPVVKHGIAVERADDVGSAIHEAFVIAATGRPGPVVVDVPSDLLKAPARAPRGAPSLPGYRPRSAPNGRQVRRAAEAIAAARRPVLYAGGGVVHAGAERELTALARRRDLPVVTTLMALGAFPQEDVRWLGMPGMYGTETANRALHEADLIVAVGARFDDRVTGRLASFAPTARVVHVDADASEIGKNVAAHVPVVGDAKAALAGIAEALAALEDGGAREPEDAGGPAGTDARPDALRGRDGTVLRPWWERIAAWRAANPARRPTHEDGVISAEATLDRLHALTGGRAVVTTDVGQHQMWAAQRLRFAGPRRWITSGGLGTMGFGLPAAIGASLAVQAAVRDGGAAAVRPAVPDGVATAVRDGGATAVRDGGATSVRDGVAVAGPGTDGGPATLGDGSVVDADTPVVCVTGDGSLVMHLQELATAVDAGAPVKVLLFDNTSLGMVRQQQDTHYAGRRAASSLPGLDWESLGRGFGVAARSVDDPADLEDALTELLAADGPALLRVGIPVDQGCDPTFAAGATAVPRD